MKYKKKAVVADEAAGKPKPQRRTVELPWMPRSSAQWRVFNLLRLAAGALWSSMVSIHRRIRRLKWKWPSYKRWEAWANRRFPGLNSQTVQQIVADFNECLAATTAARKAQKARGEKITTEYAWKTKKYHGVIYSNQAAVVRDGFLRLANDKNTPYLWVRLPRDFTLPGRIMEVELGMGVVRIVCELAPIEEPDASTAALVTTPTEAKVIGTDLGVNSSIAATDGDTAVVISGRELKAIVQWRNKEFARLDAAIAKCVEGSIRWTKLRRRRAKVREKCRRKVYDILHKSTRAIANAFPGAGVVVGEPFNNASQKMDKKNAQQVAQASTGRITRQLDYKMSGATVVPEPKSSQTCPVCGCRNLCGRIYRCKECDFEAPRDVVGAMNILSIGLHGKILNGQQIPRVVRFIRPFLKYPAASAAGSTGGAPASSSLADVQCVLKPTRSRG